MAAARKKTARNLSSISPLFLSLFSLGIIVFLFFFVTKTLKDSLNNNIARGLELTYIQYDVESAPLRRKR